MNPAARAAYTGFVVVWATAYARHYGPHVFLWFCCVANVYVLFGAWLERPIFYSMAAVSVLPIEALYTVDLAVALLTGVHPFGGTEYMLDASTPLAIRALSLYHVFVPVLIVAGLRRHGYDGRALVAQTIVSCALLTIAYFALDAEPFARDRNVDWVHGLFDRPVAGHPASAYFAMFFGYPACIHLPTHLVLERFAAVRARSTA